MKKKVINDKVFYVLFSFVVFVAVISSLSIIFWFRDNKKTEEIKKNIINTTEVEEIKDNENTEIVKVEDAPESPYWSYIKMNLINVDFEELKNTNKDVKGWIQVGGTNINYPFLQSDNNEYYLVHSFDGSYNQAGWVFMDYRNNMDNNKNTIIYAHSRLDKSMFGTLNNVIKSSWYNDNSNHIVKLSTLEENTLWQVFSVYKIPETSDYLQVSFPSDDDFMNFANNLKNRSIFDFNTSINKEDRILTLSTCYSDTERVVLHAKLIKRESR